MIYQDDPEMKELIKSFCIESKALFAELEEILENLESNPKNKADFEKFGQIIDRVMGSAKVFGFDDISNFCELGKIIGYKSSQADDASLLNVVVAILFDAVDLLNSMILKLETGNEKVLEGLNTKAFATRLKWLSQKFKNIERSSCKIMTPEEEQNNLSQTSIDDLLETLGF